MRNLGRGSPGPMPHLSVRTGQLRSECVPRLPTALLHNAGLLALPAVVIPLGVVCTSA